MKSECDCGKPPTMGFQQTRIHTSHWGMFTLRRHICFSCLSDLADLLNRLLLRAEEQDYNRVGWTY